MSTGGQEDNESLDLLQKGSSGSKSRILNHFQGLRTGGNAVFKLLDSSRHGGLATAACISCNRKMTFLWKQPGEDQAIADEAQGLQSSLQVTNAAWRDQTNHNQHRYVIISSLPLGTLLPENVSIFNNPQWERTCVGTAANAWKDSIP